MQLRDYQIECANKGALILRDIGIVYLAMEVRTGKTLTSLQVCEINGYKKVLFATKKKAISSIKEDYEKFGFSFELEVINHESIHKANGSYDAIIFDEAHRLGAFPKPSLVAKRAKEKFSKLPIVLLSGTPSPECLLQLFHQFWVSDYSIFGKDNFYKWHTNIGLIRYKFDLGYGLITNYNSNLDTMYKYYGIAKRKVKKGDSTQHIDDAMRYDTTKIKEAESKINELFNSVKVSYTQKEAGFTSEINEVILTVPMLESTYKVANKLVKDKIVVGKDKVIIADTAVKVQNKLHQIYSGTVIFEDGNSGIIDKTKAEFIQDYFKGEKVGIFYKFQAEYDLLCQIFGDSLTNCIDEFNSTDKNIALQIVAGREGISLRNAKYLVFYNIDFSAVSYWQARDRMVTMDRLNNTVYWVFSKGGIEEKIYKSVLNKKDYTLSVFRKDYKI